MAFGWVPVCTGGSRRGSICPVSLADGYSPCSRCIWSQHLSWIDLLVRVARSFLFQWHSSSVTQLMHHNVSNFHHVSYMCRLHYFGIMKSCLLTFLEALTPPCVGGLVVSRCLSSLRDLQAYQFRPLTTVFTFQPYFLLSSLLDRGHKIIWSPFTAFSGHWFICIMCRP